MPVAVTRHHWRRLPAAVVLGLVIAMCAHLGWLLRASQPAVHPAQADPIRTPASSDPLALALAAPLLADAGDRTDTPSSMTEAALEARLQGVSTGLAMPLAIIDYAGHARVLTQGDALDEDTRVQQILPDRVMLQRGARIETLMLHRTDPGPESDEQSADESTTTDEEQVQQWAHTLSESDPETAAWLRERLQELHERKTHE